MQNWNNTQNGGEGGTHTRHSPNYLSLHKIQPAQVSHSLFKRIASKASWFGKVKCLWGTHMYTHTQNTPRVFFGNHHSGKHFRSHVIRSSTSIFQVFSSSDLFSLSVEAKAVIATQRNNGNITNILQQHPFVSLPQKNNKNKSKHKIHTATKAQVSNIQKYAAFPYMSYTSPAQLSKFVQSPINKTQKYQLRYTVSKNFYSVKCLVTQSYKLNHVSKNTGNKAHLTRTYSIRPNKI